VSTLLKQIDRTPLLSSNNNEKLSTSYQYHQHMQQNQYLSTIQILNNRWMIVPLHDDTSSSTQSMRLNYLYHHHQRKVVEGTKWKIEERFVLKVKRCPDNDQQRAFTEKKQQKQQQQHQEYNDDNNKENADTNDDDDDDDTLVLQEVTIEQLQSLCEQLGIDSTIVDYDDNRTIIEVKRLLLHKLRSYATEQIQEQKLLEHRRKEKIEQANYDDSSIKERYEIINDDDISTNTYDNHNDDSIATLDTDYFFIPEITFQSLSNLSTSASRHSDSATKLDQNSTNTITSVQKY
jgi:hypothetical protein